MAGRECQVTHVPLFSTQEQSSSHHKAARLTDGGWDNAACDRAGNRLLRGPQQGHLPQPAEIRGSNYLLGEKLCRLRILKYGFYVLLRMCKQKEMREVTTSPKSGDCRISVPNTAMSQVVLQTRGKCAHTPPLPGVTLWPPGVVGPCIHRQTKSRRLFEKENWSCFFENKLLDICKQGEFHIQKNTE